MRFYIPITFILLCIVPLRAQSLGWLVFAQTERETYSFNPSEVNRENGIVTAWARVADEDGGLLKQIKYQIRCQRRLFRTLYSITYYSFDQPIDQPARRIKLRTPDIYSPDKPQYVEPAPDTVGQKLIITLCKRQE
jgi:hypothetical protein